MYIADKSQATGHNYRFHFKRLKELANKQQVNEWWMVNDAGACEDLQTKTTE